MISHLCSDICSLGHKHRTYNLHSHRSFAGHCIPYGPLHMSTHLLDILVCIRSHSDRHLRPMYIEHSRHSCEEHHIRHLLLVYSPGHRLRSLHGNGKNTSVRSGHRRIRHTHCTRRDSNRDLEINIITVHDILVSHATRP